jgi:hypothetical protein
MNLDVAYACEWLNDKRDKLEEAVRTTSDPNFLDRVENEPDFPWSKWEMTSEIRMFGGYSKSEDLDDVLDRYGLTREDLKCDHKDAFDTSFTAPLYYYDYCPYCGEKLAETECDHKDVDGRSCWLPVYSGGLSYTYCRKCGEKK